MAAVQKPAAVTSRDLAEELAKKHELPKKQAKAVLEDLVALLGKNLRKGSEIRVAGLGILQVRKRPAHAGRKLTPGRAIKTKPNEKITSRRRKTSISASTANEQTDRLARIERLATHAIDTFGSREAAMDWLGAPHRDLGGLRPIDIFDSEAGAKAVETLLGRIDHGIAA